MMLGFMIWNVVIFPVDGEALIRLVIVRDRLQQFDRTPLHSVVHSKPPERIELPLSNLLWLRAGDLNAKLGEEDLEQLLVD